MRSIQHALFLTLTLLLGFSARAQQAPSFVTQPLSQTSAVGGLVSFNVTMAGATPMSFLWNKNGKAISGANTATYTLSAVTTNDQANYTVRVANNYGAVTSDVATLTVVVPPTVSVQPKSVTTNSGSRITLAVGTAGTPPFSYQWRKDGLNLPGGTLNAFTLTSAQPEDSGAYSIQVFNAAGAATSSNAVVRVGVAPVITQGATSVTVVVGQTATFSIVATGTPLNYYWRKGTTLIAGATNATLRLENVAKTTAGYYTVQVSNFLGSAINQGAVLVVNDPMAITLQPQDLTVPEGTNVILRVAVTGTGPYRFQWRKDGLPLALTSATSANLNLAGVEVEDSGGYDVVVTNNWSAVTSRVATLKVMRYPPSISSQPRSQTVGEGSRVGLSVGATGAKPLTYQWRRDGSPIPTATSPAYILDPVMMTDSGGYDVIVANSVGSVTSVVATLTVKRFPPLIVTEPLSQSVPVGGDASFGVTVAGTQPMAFQWFKNGEAIPGATLDNHSLTNTAMADAGDYLVIITNLQGSATSQVATLTVGYPPVFVVQPLSQTNVLRGTAIFTGSVTGSPPLHLQWQRNGEALVGETNESLTLTNLRYSHRGSYSLLASNLFGQTASADAFLTFGELPPWGNLYDGLAAYYPFNGNANDESGSDNHATAVGALPTKDRFGIASSAYSFASGAFVHTTASSGFPAATSDFTVSVWLNSSGLAGDPQMIFANGGLNQFQLALNPEGETSGFLDFWTGGEHGGLPDCRSETLSWEANRWYHVLILRSNNLVTLYRDGTVIGQDMTAFGNDADTANQNLDFGYRSTPGCCPWFGQLDDIRIYNRALAANEVAQLFALETDVPVITTQPQGAVAMQGALASLAAAATAQTPLSYQWSKDGVPIATGTNATLLIPDAQPAQVGIYKVTVSNGFTGVLSLPAALAVIPSSGAGAPGFAGGQFGFGLAGPAGAIFMVEASTDLRDWLSLSTNVFGADFFPFVDSHSATSTMRFYRVKFGVLPDASAGLALIPAGVFSMGDSNDGTPAALPVHAVEVSAFYLEQLEVTKARWDEVYQWAITHGYGFDNPGLGKAPDHPVHSISWYDAVKWCNARSEQEGRAPAYYADNSHTQVYRAGQLNLQKDWVAWKTGYRLPTEAEWEKAARGSLSGQRFPWGDTISHGRANYRSFGDYPYDVSPTRGHHPLYATGEQPFTSPVGAFAPGGYGLHDMTGNVLEWVWDWYDSYTSTPPTDPLGPAMGLGRVVRGGSWGNDAAAGRVAHRDYGGPGSWNGLVGFRCLLPQP